jgi:hypothetical protein
MNIEDLLKKPEPPERICNWLDSQMSVARFYGGLAYQGHKYRIAEHEEGMPLVRVDVLDREAKADKAVAKAQAKAEKDRWTKAHRSLFCE